MAALSDIADEWDLWMIEDAAQALGTERNGAAAGTYGDLGAISFHETKNVHCGEGGALLVNDKGLWALAEMVQEKGTDRSRFHRGAVDKYTWQTIGSSYVMSEVSAAFLYAQLEHADEITQRRRRIWTMYHTAFSELPVARPWFQGNAHIYWLLIPGRDEFIAALEQRGVMAVSHYEPLHTSPAGVKYGRAHGSLEVTDRAAAELVRLPLWVDMEDGEVEQVISAVTETLGVRAAA